MLYVESSECMCMVVWAVAVTCKRMMSSEGGRQVACSTDGIR